MNLRVAVGNYSVKANLVEIGCLELQHFVNTSSVDLVGGLSDLIRRTISTAKCGSDQLLAVLVEEIVRGQVSTRRNLDQLSKSVTDLGLW